jgi:lauroyl/myristoyl acyltransferase
LDTLQLINAYRRYFILLRFLSMGFGRIIGATWVITSLGKLIHPSREKPPYTKSWKQGQWTKYLNTTCFTTALLYRMRDFQSFIKIKWDDPDGILTSSQNSGGLMLSYHHPFAYHLPAFIGSIGIEVEALALSPNESPLYPLYTKYVASWFTDTECHFHGGKWQFLYKNKNNNIRTSLVALKNGKLVYSLHDFPNIYPDAKTLPFLLTDKSFLTPEGLIGPATKMRLPISVAYVRWLGGTEVSIHIRTLNSCGRDNRSPAEIMNIYSGILNELVSKDPEFWEAWGSIQ